MRRIFVPAVLAMALLAGNASSASAFGHLKSLFGGNSACDTACCEPVCEPVCGCEPVYCEPICGAEPCSAPKMGLLQKLLHKKNCFASSPYDACCEPVCGVEPMYSGPVCGVEPMCGAEPVCCEPAPAPCRPFGGFFARMFSKKHACDAGCCDVIEPSCGFEPTCGCEAPCGCH